MVPILHGKLTNSEDICMKVPHGFEKHFTGNMVIRLLKIICGLKQEVMAFWRMLLLCMETTDMSIERSTEYSYLCHDWSAFGLVVDRIIGSK